jgi:hypothetical protein
MVISSDRRENGQFDIFYTTRVAADAAFEPPIALDSVSSAGFDGDAALTADGLTLYFYSTRQLPDGGSGSETWVAQREKRTDAFGPPQLVSYNDPVHIDSQPFFARHAAEMWFVSTRPGVGLSDIYSVRAIPGSAAQFEIGTLDRVDELNTPADEWAPTLSLDGKTIYFASTRSDGGAKGGRDIWKATRAAVTDKFGLPTNVAELNTGDDDVPGFLSDDGCRLYFHRTLAGGGAEAMFVATKPK